MSSGNAAKPAPGGGPLGAPGSQTVRVVLADDHSGFRAAAHRYLATQPVEVVGAAATGREALRLVESLKPDLLLLDLEMPDLDGLAVLGQVKARPGAPRVVVVTLHDHEAYRAAAAGGGADGFVAKHLFTTALGPLLRRLFPGVR